MPSCPAPILGRSTVTAARTRSELGADGPLVVTVGRLAEQKGLPLLLAAAGLLRAFAAGSRAPLFVARRRRAAGGRIAAPHRRRALPVRLLGRRDDVPDLLAAADVVVVPSSWEGQPLVVQEALRAGAPLVATAVGRHPGPRRRRGRPGAVRRPGGPRRRDRGAPGRPRRARLSAAPPAPGPAELPDDADAVDAALSVYRRLSLIVSKPVDGLILQSHT